MRDAAPTASWQGPLRLAAAIVVVGVLFVWLVKPIGNPCPDLGKLPPGSTAHSSPSFSPPATRTCTYVAAEGIRATSKYVPVLDWIVILLVAAVVAGGARMLAPGGREARAAREPRPVREPRRVRESRRAREPRPERARRVPRAERPPPPEAGPLPERAPKPPRPARAERAPKAPRQPKAAPPTTGERDAAERERARRERAERARRGR